MGTYKAAVKLSALAWWDDVIFEKLTVLWQGCCATGFGRQSCQKRDHRNYANLMEKSLMYIKHNSGMASVRMNELINFWPWHLGILYPRTEYLFSKVSTYDEALRLSTETILRS